MLPDKTDSSADEERKKKRALKAKNWKSNNRDKYRARRRAYGKRNLKTLLEKARRRRLREPYWKHYLYAKKRCRVSGSYFKRGIKFQLTLGEVKALWLRDGAASMIKPSIDRKDTYGHYVFDNCRFIEFLENCRRPKRKPQH